MKRFLMIAVLIAGAASITMGPLLLAQGGSYGLAGKLASTNIVLPFLCAALGGSLIVAGLLVPLGIIGTLVGYTLGPNMLASRLPSRTVMALATLGTAALLFALATIGLLFRDSTFTVNVMTVSPGSKAA